MDPTQPQTQQSLPTSSGVAGEELKLSDITQEDLLADNLRLRALNGGLTEEEFRGVDAG